MVGEVREARVAVFDRHRMRALGREAVVHREHRHAASRDVAPHHRVVGIDAAENHAAAVEIEGRGALRAAFLLVPAKPHRCAVGAPVATSWVSTSVTFGSIELTSPIQLSNLSRRSATLPGGGGWGGGASPIIFFRAAAISGSSDSLVSAFLVLR